MGMAKSRASQKEKPASYSLNSREIKRTDAEIDRVLNWAVEGEQDGSHYRGMNYEQGINAFAAWLFGDVEDDPTGA
jgi:hypothetical protein